MLHALLSKELRLATRSRRVWWAFGAMAILCGTSAAVGTIEHRARATEHAALTNFAEKSFAGQKPDHPHSIAHNGYVVSRPPAPLGFLDGGIETAYGRWLRLDAHQTRPLAGARTSELVRGPGAGRFDLGLLLAMFAPVVVLLLVFDQIARERRRGTLAMLSAAGLSWWPYALSKLYGAAIRMAIAIGLPAVVASVVASVVVGSMDLGRLGLFFVVHTVALVAWALVLLTLSSWAASSRSALVAGFLVWGALALFVPPLSGAVSQIVAPVAPPGANMVKAQSWAESAHRQTESLRSAALAEIRRRHPNWNGEGDPPEVVDAVMLALADRDAAKKMRALFSTLDAEQDRQERWAASLSLVSPSGLASLASSAIAGSDLAHMRGVFEHYEAYRRELMTWFNGWWAKEGKGGFGDYDDEKKFDAFDQAPRPAVPHFSLGFAARRASFSLLLLILTTFVVAMIYGSAVRRSLRSGAGR